MHHIWNLIKRVHEMYHIWKLIKKKYLVYKKQEQSIMKEGTSKQTDIDKASDDKLLDRNIN